MQLLNEPKRNFHFGRKFVPLSNERDDASDVECQLREEHMSPQALNGPRFANQHCTAPFIDFDPLQLFSHVFFHKLKKTLEKREKKHNFHL
jgi:hypothetical protein